MMIVSVSGRKGWLAIACAMAVLAARAQAMDSPPSDIAPTRARAIQRRARLLNNTVRDASKRGKLRPVRWEVLNQVAVAAGDASLDGIPGTPMRIGTNRPVPNGRILQPRNSGTSSTLADGTRIWSLQLEVPTAQAIRVHFKQLKLAPQTRLVLTGSVGFEPQVLTSGTHVGRDGFWSTPLPGGVAYVEYQDPTGKAAAPLILIDEVSEIYRGFQKPGGIAGSIAASLCAEDVSCHAVDLDARDAVGRMIFTIPGEGSFLCTGALLIDADPNTSAGYFLTANHCIGTDQGAESLTVYWFYQSSRCNTSPPSLLSVPRSDGAVLLATSSRLNGGTDSTLLRLNDDPSNGQTFAAWSTETLPVGSPVVGIHHPGGEKKQYSEGFTTSQGPICGILPTSRYIYNDWTLGLTEGGSSGSPLFNKNWQVVGQLFGVCFNQGITPGCNNQSQFNNVYGKMSQFFQQISPFLLSTANDDLFEQNDTAVTAAPIDPGTYSLRLVDFDDYFGLTLNAASNVVVSALFDVTAMDLNLFILDANGTVVASSATAASLERINTTLPAGTYTIRVAKDAGWGGDYTFTIESYLANCIAPTPPTVSPETLPSSRYISFVPAAISDSVAYMVTLVDLNNPSPQNVFGSPEPDFSVLNGARRWVGDPVMFERTALPPALGFASPLSCAPVTRDWSKKDTIFVHGEAIVPSSTYEIRAIQAGCDPADMNNFSPAIVVTTSRWADVKAPFQDPLAALVTQPDVSDLTAVINAVQLLAGSLPRDRVQLQPALVNPTAKLNVLDIAMTSDAIRREPYPFSNIPWCP